MGYDQALRYYWFADRFGWTPQQVDTAPALLTARLMTIGEVRDDVAAAKQHSELG